MNTTWMPITNASGDDGPSVVNNHNAVAIAIAPGSTRGRGPSRSYNAPTGRPRNPRISPPGSTASPLTNVVVPSTVCR